MDQPTNSKESALPAGTVTFLFTDIEGSTPLWERMPEAMRVAVAQHHALLRQAIEQNGGQVFQIIGDAFQAAFRLASQGLAAAVAAQRALQAAQWGETGPLRVRMGLHTGPAELDPNGDAPYAVSHTLNRAARIMSAGHGGQILLSLEAKNLVERRTAARRQPAQPGRTPAQRAGYPEHSTRSTPPELGGFPLLATALQHPNNLPHHLTSFIGREDEIRALQEKITAGGCRLLTLTGSGGTGKTRLSLQVAAQVLDAFPDGVWLVELAPLGDPELVASSVAQALGLREVPGVPILQTLSAISRTAACCSSSTTASISCRPARSMAAGPAPKLPAAHLLATSREILNVPGETPFRVPSLPVPDPRQMPPFEQVAQAEAVRLFVERASQAAPGFVLDEGNADPWSPSATAWTASPWRLNWRRRACGCCRYPRSPPGWTMSFAC
jgi:class 3 adenylate cyclase